MHIVTERGHGIVDRVRVVLLQRLKQGGDIVVEVVAAASIAGRSATAAACMFVGEGRSMVVMMRIRRRDLIGPCRRRRVGDRSRGGVR
jgi:hypothetical protein